MIGKVVASRHIQRLHVLPVGADGDTRRLATVPLFLSGASRLITSSLLEVHQAFGSGSGCAALKAGDTYGHNVVREGRAFNLLNPAHNPVFRLYNGTKYESQLLFFDGNGVLEELDENLFP